MKKIILVSSFLFFNIVHADQFMGNLAIDGIKNNNLAGMNKTQKLNFELNDMLRVLVQQSNYNQMLGSYLDSDNYKQIIKNSKITDGEAKKLKSLTSDYIKNYINNSSANDNAFDNSGYYTNIKLGYQRSEPNEIKYITKEMANASFGDDLLLYRGCIANLVRDFLKQNGIEQNKDFNDYNVKNSYNLNDVLSYDKPSLEAYVPIGGTQYCYGFKQITTTKDSFLSKPSDYVTEYRYVYSADEVTPLNNIVDRSNQFCRSKECYLLYGLTLMSPEYMSAIIHKIPTKDETKPTMRKTVSDQQAINLPLNSIKNASKSSYNLAFYIYGQAIAYACNINVLNKNKSLSTQAFNSCLGEVNSMYNASYNNGQGMYPYQKDRYAKGLNDGITAINKNKPTVEQSEIILKNIANLHIELANRGLITGTDYPEIHVGHLFSL